MNTQHRAVMPLMASAFRTTESYGPDKHYVMTFKFQSLADLHAADGEWRQALAASQPVAPEAPTDNLIHRIENEIAHSEINEIRLTPAFGKIAGPVAVSVTSLRAVIEGWKKAHGITGEPS